MVEKLKMYLRQLMCGHGKIYYVITYIEGGEMITVFCKYCNKQLSKNNYERTDCR